MLKKMLLIVLGIILFIVFGLLASLTSADRQVLLGKPDSIIYNDQKRDYRVYVPDNVQPNARVVVVFHGFSSDSRQIAYVTGMHNVVDNDTITVYPEAVTPSQPGLKKGWNAGFCCGSGWVTKTDDVGFVATMLDQLAEDYSIDTDKIYATGFSNGGMFVHRLATELPDRFAGFAAVSGSIGANDKTVVSASPKPMLLIHGESDTIVPFKGGQGGSDASFTWQAFADSQAYWEKANQAKQPTTTDEADRHVTTYVDSSKPLKIITYKNKGHSWPDWRLVKPWHHQPAGSHVVNDFFKDI